MSRLRCWNLFVLTTAIFALTTSPHVVAQQKQTEDPGFKNLPDPGGSLIDLWKKRKLGSGQPNFNQEMLKSLMKQFGGVNPQNIDPEVLKNFIQQNPLFQNKDQLNEFKDFFDEFLEKNQGKQQVNPFKNLDPDKLFGGLKNQQEQWEKNRPPVFNPGEIMPKKVPNFPKNDFQPPVPKEGKELANGLGKMFGDLDSIKDLMKGFSQLDAKGANGWGNDLPNWMPNMGKFGLEDFADWGKKNLGNMKFDFPNLNIKAPNFGGGAGFGGGGFGGFGSGGSSSGGGSTPMGGSGSLGGLWIIPLLIGGGIILWLLLQKFGDREPKTPLASLVVVPPIDPNDIRTRQDLVEAFDRLSVRNYGATARVWNHRIIGSKLENTIPAPHANAVHELTNLYEQARYLPAELDLSEQQFSLARQHLRTLTEVGPR